MAKKKSFEQQKDDLKKAAEAWNRKSPAQKKADRAWGDQKKKGK